MCKCDTKGTVDAQRWQVGELKANSAARIREQKVVIFATSTGCMGPFLISNCTYSVYPDVCTVPQLKPLSSICKLGLGRVQPEYRQTF